MWLWWNEERRETATVQAVTEDGQKEGINDQNDRGEPHQYSLRTRIADWSAIRQTLTFYAEHLRASTSNPAQLILLTDDRMNRQIAQREGLLAVSAKEFVDGLNGDVREALVDLVVGGVDEIEPSERRGRRIYDEVCSHGVPDVWGLTCSTSRKIF